MDGVSVAASIISIATAGIQVSIRLVTLSTQVSSASERVSSIGNDVSLTSGVLHQLGDLMSQKTSSDGISIFSQGGLETTRTSAAMCERIFMEIEKEVGKASEQLRTCRKIAGGKVKLSKSEKLKWPFLQPSVDLLRADLREAKGTLMLMLQVTTLALSKKMADFSATATSEQGDLYRAIVALHQQQHHHHQKNQEAAGKEERLSGGSTDLASTKFQQDSDSVASRVTAWDCPPTLSRSATPRADQNPSYTPVPSLVTISNSANRWRNESTNNGSPGDNFVTLATRQAENPGTPLAEKSVFSNVTHMTSESSFNSSNASTSSSTLENSSVHDGMKDNDIPQDYQVQVKILEQQNKKHLLFQRARQFDDPASPRKSNLPSGGGSELRMFMLKPIVKDFFDKIELSWSIQNPKMPVSAIQKHLACMEADGLPSVMDMLETLYDHEHSIIDAHQGQGNLLSLKRTKTDIQHRDIVFKGVPGLQFVVEPGRELKDSSETVESRESEKGAGSLYSMTPTFRRRASNLLGKEEAGKKTSVVDVPDQSLGSWTDKVDDTAIQHTPLSEDHRTARFPILQPKNTAPTRNVNMMGVEEMFLPENERAMKETKSPGFSVDLQGMLVNEQGLVIGPKGVPVAKVREGNLQKIAGRPLNSDLEVIDDFDNVVGLCELLPETDRENMSQGPFAGLGLCVVVEGGMVSDREGNVVGQVFEGDAECLTGYAVRVDGNVIDKFGQVKGCARSYEEPEEELADISFPKQMSTSGRDRSTQGDSSTHEASEIVLTPEEELELQKQPLQEMEAQSSKTDHSGPPFPPRLSLPTEEELHPKMDQDQQLQHPPASGSSPSKAPTSGRFSEKSSTEIFKSFRVSTDGSVEKLLPAAMKKYNINADSSNYDLYVVYADHERRLERHEQPLLIFKQLDKEGKKPKFMLKKRPAPLSSVTTSARKQWPPSARAEMPAQLDAEAKSEDTRYFDKGPFDGLSIGTKEDSITGVSDEAEYTDEYDDDDDDAAKEGKAPQVDIADEKRIVEDLLWQYTTWRPGGIQLPGGVL